VKDIPGPLPAADRLLELMAQDKKVKHGTPTFILMRAIGAAFIDTGVDYRDVHAFLTEKLAEQ
jgi:3-dehydroquinate synthetase